MSAPLAIRPVALGDQAAVRAIVHGTNMFYPDEVDTAVELVDQCLARGPEASGYHAYVGLLDGEPVAYACFGPTPLTRGTFDLYWIVVDARVQGRGAGKALVAFVLARMRELGGRLLVAETAGRAEYAPTRAFYDRAGFELASEIADFYDVGDSKVTYVIRP
jgi:GNAT superfamily N-acetyltransferase